MFRSCVSVFPAQVSRSQVFFSWLCWCTFFTSSSSFLAADGHPKHLVEDDASSSFNWQMLPPSAVDVIYIASRGIDFGLEFFWSVCGLSFHSSLNVVLGIATFPMEVQMF